MRKAAPNDYFKPLPTRIREMRAKKGYTQASLAEKVETSKSNIGNYETGVNVPPADTLVELAKALDVSTDYLLGKSDAETNDTNEQAICDYLGLDIKTVRTLHATRNDSAMHVAIDYLFAQKTLLSSITAYTWSILPDLIKTTEYSVLPYYNLEMLCESAKNAHLNLFYALPDYLSQVRTYCDKDPIRTNRIIYDYVTSNVDICSIITNLVDMDPCAMPQFFQTWRNPTKDEMDDPINAGIIEVEGYIEYVVSAMSDEDRNLFYKVVNMNKSTHRFVKPAGKNLEEYYDDYKRVALKVLEDIVHGYKTREDN